MLKKITESSATIVAAVIGGIFAVSSAVLPQLMNRQPIVESNPSSAAPVAVAVSTTPLVPNLTYGSWTLHESTDADGTVWDNSTLKFTQQLPTADGLQLAGYFEWRTNNELQGRELFVGNYIAASRQLFIEGRQIEDAVSPRLGVGSFSAKLDEEARALIDGRWGTPAGNLANIPGSWSARR
jgi:hypothetical protein